MTHSKETWKEDVLKYLEKNSDRKVSIKEIFSMYGLVSTTLLDAVEELRSENKISTVRDEKNKIWLTHKKEV